MIRRSVALNFSSFEHKSEQQTPLASCFFSPLITIIIQKISIAHNPQLKARARSAYRKTHLCTNTRTEKKNRADHDYHTMDNHAICEEREKKCRTTARKVESPETTIVLTVASVHQHIFK